MLSTDNIILLLKFVITFHQIKINLNGKVNHYMHIIRHHCFFFTKKAYTVRFKFCFNFLMKLALSILI